MDYSADINQRRGPEEMGRGERVLRGIGWGLWQVVRWPVLTFLIVLEPVVVLVFGLVALLGTLTALFFGLVVHPAHFPFWGMLGFSLSCGGLLMLYYGLIRLLSPR